MGLRFGSVVACLLGSVVACSGLCAAIPFADPPPYPGRESWTFLKELSESEKPPRFAASCAETNGDFWVRNRISRCYFGPIKRPPLNRDELMDDVDYYPDAYLARLQREGVNGLWLTVEWRDLAETSFTSRNTNADRRLSKLRRTVDKCLKYGIKTWIFCIEPRACKDDDSLYASHPEMFGSQIGWCGHLMCPLTKETQLYVEESITDIFRRVPRLGGVMMISHGERGTTCLSTVDSVTGKFIGGCPRCAQVRPWQIHYETASAIMRGIRAAGSDAEFVSWFYHPQACPERAEWVAEVAHHLPEGVTLAYNFESGAVEDQLGRPRVGGDYWQSFVGPACGFRRVAEAGRSSNARIGAKIQVCNSHEVATVPFVPVPGLLYRKYKAMREMGVSTVLQCWYFGSYPGLMNEAAGLLSRCDFAEDEKSFLLRLAKPHWGPDSLVLADLWGQFSDAYANYPLSNNMQYYGPFHAGVVWPLLPDVWMLPLGRTWKPHDRPSGDVIGECLENHTIEEAVELSARMAEGAKVIGENGRNVLDVLAERWQDDAERMRDIGVMRALACQFASGHNIFTFYRDRATAIYESRVRGDTGAALAALKRMDAAVMAEEGLTREMLPLARFDSRLGFHSEAEVHQYHPAKLKWRLDELARTHRRISEIVAEIENGRTYPLSEHERQMPVCAMDGKWMEAGCNVKFRVLQEGDDGLVFDFSADRPIGLRVVTMDAAGVSHYRLDKVILHDSKQIKTMRIPAGAWGDRADRRPEWLQIVEDPEFRLEAGEFNLLWPRMSHPDGDNWRLNLSPICARACGRLVWRR